MIRILLLALLIYLLYRFFRKMIQPPAENRPQGREYGAAVGNVDEMVQDPMCGTYVPLREAEKRTIDGKDYFFCSETCADRFEKGERRARSDT